MQTALVVTMQTALVVLDLFPFRLACFWPWIVPPVWARTYVSIYSCFLFCVFGTTLKYLLCFELRRNVRLHACVRTLSALCIIRFLFCVFGTKLKYLLCFELRRNVRLHACVRTLSALCIIRTARVTEPPSSVRGLHVALYFFFMLL